MSLAHNYNCAMKIQYYIVIGIISMIIMGMTLTGCRKDIDQPFLEQEFSLVDKLEGNYTGYKYHKLENIDCPTCMPPCNFTYTYDTIFVNVRIDKINEDSIQLTDLTEDYATRSIPIDSTLNYSGGAPNPAPSGHYNLSFQGANNDSLILDILAGGGNNCYGSFHYGDYVLVKN